MRKILSFALFVFLFAPSAARAQTTTIVTGTITDPNGVPYSGASIKAQVSIPGATVQITSAAACTAAGLGAAPCYAPFQGTVGPTSLDVNGSFTMGLYPNASIFDARGGAISTQWIFTVSIAPGVLPPWGTGPQVFSVSITIAGASQSVSTTLSAAALALTRPLSAGSANVAPNQTIIYASQNCGAQTNCYPVVGDGTTDNLADFTALSSAANAATRTSINGQPQPITVALAQGHYKYSGGLSFTQPTTLRCETGAVLDYTGSAHAVDVGPSGLVSGTLQSGQYSIGTGCEFTGGASMTEGIFVNQFIVQFQLVQNTLNDFGNMAAYDVYADGENWSTNLDSNRFLTDDNVKRNLVFMNNRDQNSQLHFTSNFVACLNGAFPTVGCTNPGIGIVSGGTGSLFADNNINFFAPNIIIPQAGNGTRLYNNYTEENVASVAVPDIQYGLAGDTTLDGLIVNGLYVNQHTNNSPIGPGNVSMTLTNASVFNVYVLPTSLGAAKVVAQNNLTGQVGNSFGQINTISINTAGSNITTWSGLGNATGAGGFQNFFGTVNPPVFTVATLPSASGNFAGATVVVSDAMTFTPGTCTGGGADFMLAVSNGTTWSCH